MLDAEGKHAEAEAENRAVLKLQEKVLGPGPRDTLLSRNNLANVLDAEGKHVEAEADIVLVLKLKERFLACAIPDARLPYNLAVALDNEANTLKRRQNIAPCSSSGKRFSARTPRHALTSRNNLADAKLSSEGKHAEAAGRISRRA